MHLGYMLKGKTVEIISLDFKDEEVIHKLNNIGLVPQAQLKILDYNKSKKVLHLLIYNVQYVLREQDCQHINVQIVEK